MIACIRPCSKSSFFYHKFHSKRFRRSNQLHENYLIDTNTEMRTIVKVISFETLNPRPEILLENIKVLNRIFSQKLKEKLFLIFLNASQNDLDLQSMRNQMLSYYVI